MTGGLMVEAIPSRRMRVLTWALRLTLLGLALFRSKVSVSRWLFYGLNCAPNIFGCRRRNRSMQSNSRNGGWGMEDGGNIV